MSVHRRSCNLPFLLVLVLAAVGGAVLKYEGLFTSKVFAQDTRVQPFYLEKTIVVPDQQGALVVFRKEITARRSDGATARAQSFGSGTPPVYVRNVVLLNGANRTLFDAINARNTWPTLDSESLNRLRHSLTSAPRDCGAPENLLRFDQVRGEPVAVLQNIVPGKYRVVRWVAPGLGCEDLYSKSESLNSDGTFTLSLEAQTTDFTRGDPDPRWFDMGDTFTEMKPSYAHRRFLQHIGMPLDSREALEFIQHGERSDQRYGVVRGK